MSRTSLLAAAIAVAVLSAAAPAPAQAQANLPLQAVGPVSPVHPFPLWYRDSSGAVTLEPCLDNLTTVPVNPCALAAGPGLSGGTFNPAQPITFPTNFPASFHYFLANSEVSIDGNNRGLVFIAELVGTFTAGDPLTPQVFTHLRFDTNVPFVVGAAYTITHPYGTFTLAADDRGDLCPANNKACDIFFPSPAPVGAFNGVLVANPGALPNAATVGAFLPVTTPPPGFIGDGGAKTTVSGSQTGTNSVRITGPGITNSCGAIPSCSESTLFTVVGRRFLATGGPVARFAVSGPAGPVGAGTQQTYTVTATDVNGNTVSTYAGTVHFTSSDPQASLPGDAPLASGTGTFQATPRTVGTFVLTATDTLVATRFGSATTAVSAGPAASIEVASGDGQIGAPGAQLPAQLVARVRDQFGNPSSGLVTFTAPAGGLVAPGTFTANALTGLASTTATLAGTLGAQIFTAQVQGVAAPASFSATAAQPGVATTIEITGLPPTATAGTPAGFTVTARDAFGAVATLATGAAGALTITSSDPEAILPVTPSLLLGTGAFSITFRNALVRSVTASLTATPSITATVSTTVVAGPAARIQPISGGGQAGPVTGTLAQPLVVRVGDLAGNNAVAGVTVAFAAPPGGSVTPTSAVTGADGTASAVARLGTAAGAQAFTATVAGLIGSPATFTATAAPGPATAVTISGLAGTVTAGTSAGFTVTARDDFGNVATSFNGGVGIIHNDPVVAQPPQGALSAGTGSFTQQLRTAGARSITATLAGTAISATAATIVTAAAAATLAAASGNGQSAILGASLGAPLVVKATDAFGNAVTGVVVSFAGPATANITPGAVATGADGLASANASLPTILGPHTFTASAAGLTGSPVAFTATALPGPASVLEVTGLAPSTTAGVPAAFTVTARDLFGNVATGFAGTVTFTSTDPGATLPPPASLPGGTAAFQATFTTAGTRILTATQTGSPAVAGSGTTAVSPAAPATATFPGRPPAADAGLSFTVTVEVRDAFGNAPADPGLVFTSSDPNAVLPPNPVLSGATGTFTITLVTAGSQTVSVSPAGAPAVSASFGVNVAAGPASALVALSGGGQAGTVATPLGAPFVVKATDAFGNAKAGLTVTFASPLTGSVNPVSAVTGTDGTAGALATLGNTAGPQTFTASSLDIPGAFASFPVTASPGPGVSLSFSGLPSSVAAGAAIPLSVVVLDQFGNLATGFGGVVSVTTSDPAATLPAPGTLTSGAGTFVVALKTTGGQTVVVASPGGPGLTKQGNTIVTPAAPATLALVSAPGATPVNATAASPIVVLVTDSLGNPVPSYSVQFQPASGAGGSIAPTNTTTGPDGRASATPTMGTTAGPYQFQAVATLIGTGAQLAGSPLLVSVTATPGAAAGLALGRTTNGTLDDCDCYPLTARLRDQFNNTVAQAVEVTVTLTNSAQVTATDLAAAGLPAGTVTGPLKPDGTAALTVCDGKPESAVVTLTSSTAGLGTATQNLTWNLGPFGAAASLIVSDIASVTAFSGEAHLTVTPRSACGNPLGATQVVTLGLSGPGSLTPVVNAGNGIYTSTLTVDTCPATTTRVTGRVGAADLTPLDVGVLCIVPSADQTGVQIDRPTVLLCDNAAKDAVHVTVTPRDGGGVGMGAGNTVALSMPGLTGGAVTDVGDGSYTATLSSSTCAAGPRQLTVTVNGVALAKPAATIDFSCAPVDPSASGVSPATANVVADNAATAALTVAAVNTCGDPVRAAAVSVSTNLGTLAAVSGTTDSAGTFGTTIRSGTAGPATVQATVGGVAVTSATVTFDPPPKSGGGGCGTGGGGGVLALLGVGLGLGTLRRRARR